MPNIHELIRHHVTLSIRCLDRLYLHAYMPKLQTSGGLCYFLRDHLGHPIPSPALFAPDARPLRRRRQDVRDRARHPADPVRARPAERRHRRRLSRAAADGRRRGRDRRGAREDAGVQGPQLPRPGHGRVPSTSPGSRSPSITTTSTSRTRLGPRLPQDRHVPALSGQAVSQRPRVGEAAAAARTASAFESLDNGFLACADPARLQAICDRARAGRRPGFFDRWSRGCPGR